MHMDNESSDHSFSSNKLIRKLESLSTLSVTEKVKLAEITSNPSTIPAQTDLIREGDQPDGVYLILEGIACRYKLRPSGTRQIMAYLLPGDFCDLDVALLKRMDHALGTLSECRVVRIDLETIASLTEEYDSIERALRTATLVDEATLREWLVNLGRRSPEERIAHLLLELKLRFGAVGLSEDSLLPFPMSVQDLADTTGLSSVHVTRALNSLQGAALIRMLHKKVEILDPAGLERLSGFKANYLHLGDEVAA